MPSIGRPVHRMSFSFSSSGFWEALPVGSWQYSQLQTINEHHADEPSHLLSSKENRGKSIVVFELSLTCAIGQIILLALDSVL
jgi:hypothetical protein